MYNGTAQVLRTIIREELKPVRAELVKQLEPIKKTLDNHTRILDDHTKKLNRLESKVDALSGDVEQLHMEVKGNRDEIGLWHQRDKREIDEIKTHVGLPLMPDSP